MIYAKKWYILLTIISLLLAICGCYDATAINLDPSEPEEIPPENVMTIQLPERSKEAINYPLQFARVFYRGEIANFPQLVLDGIPLVTQADVKSRWPDGSVKYAILACIIPTLESTEEPIAIRFQNQSTGNNDGAETKENMLANYDFDAIQELQNSREVFSASARRMLQDDYFTYWQKGPIVTTILLGDHSEKRTYDNGFDENHSYRPTFIASFWPALKAVKIRFIGEITHSEVLQNQNYSLRLLISNSLGTEVLNAPLFAHYAMSRWTKVYWLGGTPAQINLWHNVEYLKATRVVPNYDTSKVIPESTIASYYTSWTSANKGILQRGLWEKAMPTTGGRPDIGPYPDWMVAWLYTGDARLQELCLGQADLAAAWPMHIREGRPATTFDAEEKVTGVGRILSLNARPTLWTERFDYTYTDPKDKITFIGTITNGGWIVDRAHQPDPFSLAYLFTGDYFYLEQMYFWSGWNAFGTSPADNYFYGRGPKSSGGIHGEPRAQAWAFRNRVRAEFLAPDADPEKAYFKKLAEDAIAIWEGGRGIRGTTYETSDNWKWGNQYAIQMWPDETPPPLHQWDIGTTQHANNDNINKEITYHAFSPWEMNFIMFSLGHARELGYKTDALLRWCATCYTNIISNPAMNPYFLSSSRMPVLRKSDQQYFETWEELSTGYNPEFDFKKEFESIVLDATHGYPIIAIPAGAYSRDIADPLSLEAWEWVKENCLSSPSLMKNPKWAIIPRRP